MNAVTPAHKTIAAMIADEMYSIRPYPYGCFLSRGLLASFTPIIVMMEDNASVRLLTASNVIAMEFVTIPTNALNATRMRLTIMPITLVLMIFPVLSYIKILF